MYEWLLSTAKSNIVILHNSEPGNLGATVDHTQKRVKKRWCNQEKVVVFFTEDKASALVTKCRSLSTVKGEGVTYFTLLLAQVIRLIFV